MNGNILAPQDMLPLYLSHNNVINLVQPFLNDSAWAQANGKPYIMMETNTASCGGFPGVSDTLGAALWGVDYSLHMAYANFTAAMFHNGGQNTYYNVRTPILISLALTNFRIISHPCSSSNLNSPLRPHLELPLSEERSGPLVRCITRR